MKHREADFQTIFGKYIRIKKLYGNFELKRTSTDKLLLSEVKPHQLAGLLAAQENGFFWKLSDADPRQKPFDCSFSPPCDSWIVIRYPGVFFIILATCFAEECKDPNKKSISKQRAREICAFEVEL